MRLNSAYALAESRLDRIAAAVDRLDKLEKRLDGQTFVLEAGDIEEREHLLEAARLLRRYIEQDQSAGYFVTPLRDTWYQAERARKAKGT